MPSTQPRKIVPAVYLLATIVVIGFVHHVMPLALLWQEPIRFIGVALIVGGLVIAGVAADAFARAKTPVLPFHRSTALLTGGLFRVTRNPIYLGMVFVLLGVAVWLGSAGAFFPIPVFMWLIHTQFIVPEEQFLTEIFGADYLLYRQRVRRWL